MSDDIDWDDPSLLQYCSASNNQNNNNNVSTLSRQQQYTDNVNNNRSVTANTIGYYPPAMIYRPSVSQHQQQPYNTSTYVSPYQPQQQQHSPYNQQSQSTNNQSTPTSTTTPISPNRPPSYMINSNYRPVQPPVQTQQQVQSQSSIAVNIPYQTPRQQPINNTATQQQQHQYQNQQQHRASRLNTNNHNYQQQIDKVNTNDPFIANAYNQNPHNNNSITNSTNNQHNYNRSVSNNTINNVNKCVSPQHNQLPSYMVKPLNQPAPNNNFSNTTTHSNNTSNNLIASKTNNTTVSNGNATTNNSFDIPDDVFLAIDVPSTGNDNNVNNKQTTNNNTYNNPFTKQQQHNNAYNNNSTSHTNNNRSNNTTNNGNIVNPFAHNNPPVNPFIANSTNVSITSNNFLAKSFTPSAPTQQSVNDKLAQENNVPRVPMCIKHELAMTKNTTRKPGANFGRQFWCCGLSGDDSCKTFVWANDYVALNKLKFCNPDMKPSLTVTIELLAVDKILLYHMPYNPELHNIIKHKFNGTTETAHKGLIFQLNHQQQLIECIIDYCNNHNMKVKYDSIEEHVLKLLTADRKQHVALMNTQNIDNTDDVVDESSNDVLDDTIVDVVNLLADSAKPIATNKDNKKHNNNNENDDTNINTKKRKRTYKPKGSLQHTYTVEPLFKPSKLESIVYDNGSTLWSCLMPFQQQGAEYAINHMGRAHISDEMGLGKTIQAIAVAQYYRHEWPLLVVCPSSVRYNWKQELLSWLNDLNDTDINVIMSGSNKIDTNYAVTIMSYDLCVRMDSQLRTTEFNIIIADESHYVKSATARRTQVVTPLIKRAKRALLLSGTPALNRPAELYTQIDCLLPGLLPTYKKFATRYCDGHQGRFGWEAKGGTNLTELYLLLTKHVMIRREKSAVLTQLPSKRRQQIIIDVPDSQKLKKKYKNKNNNDNSSIERLLAMAINGDDSISANNQPTLFSLFRETGLAKLQGITDYMEVLIESDIKFLVFGKHIAVLDGIEEKVKKQNIDYIRIDGSTKPELRQILATKFQNDNKVRVAILSTQAGR